MNTYRVHVEVNDPHTLGRETRLLPTQWVDASNECSAVAKVGIALAQSGWGVDDIFHAEAVLETN